MDILRENTKPLAELKAGVRVVTVSQTLIQSIGKLLLIDKDPKDWKWTKVAAHCRKRQE